MPNLQRGGGGEACLHFAYFSMRFRNPGDPNGGHGTMASPKYAPDQDLFGLSNAIECIVTNLHVNVILLNQLTVKMSN